MAPSRGYLYSPGASRLHLVSLFALQLFGFLLFAKGFWPLKTLLDGHAEPIEGPPPVSRLAFVLVDALRTDLAVGADSAMSYTKRRVLVLLARPLTGEMDSLVESGEALAYTAISRPPTVTLPRLKAMTTGSSPAFLDAILNLKEEEDSSQAAFANIDSWLWQLRHVYPERKTIFLGDDTWLRLFPRDWFAFADGVTSFFVSDHTVVDQNVTRHLDDLLSHESSIQWDALILHYLGLDHIGHAFGDSHSLMKTKQEEMDDIVKRVFENLKRRDKADGKRSLLVLCGDHGMTPTGNHGGSSEPETSAALLFASPALDTPDGQALRWTTAYRLAETVEQVDMVPTLASLLGVGIPINSAGRAIPAVLRAFLPEGAVSRHLRQNARQLEALLIASGQSVSPWSASSNDGELQDYLRTAKETLLRMQTDVRLELMLIGLVLLSIAALSMLRLSYYDASSDAAPPCTKQVVGLFLFIFALSVFSTSFIEEEHEARWSYVLFWRDVEYPFQTWFFGGATLILLLGVRQHPVPTLSLLITLRTMRGWSHNGQKAFFDDSIASKLAPLRRPPLISPLALSIVASIAIPSLYRSSPSSILLPALQTLHLGSMAVSELIRGATKHQLTDAYRIQWALTVLSVLRFALARSSVRRDPISLLYTLSLLLLSFARHTSAPVMALCWLQLLCLQRMSATLRSPLLLSAAIAILQHVAFFATGGSNSLATVDLSQAFNGIRTFSLPLVSLFTFLSNFAAPIYWSIASVLVLPRSRARVVHLATLHSIALFALAVATLVFRDHLFIYTVFSPALLYRAVWSFLLHGIFELAPTLLFDI